MLFSPVRPDVQVKATRDVYSGVLGPMTGVPTVRKGQRGIVNRQVSPGGWFSSPRWEVEFGTGLLTVTVAVEERHLRPLPGAGGRDAWTRRRNLVAGVKLGAFLFLMGPFLVSLFVFLVLQGGSVSEVVAVLPEVVLEEVVGLLSMLGATGSLLLGVAVAAWLKLRR